MDIAVRTARHGVELMAQSGKRSARMMVLDTLESGVKVAMPTAADHTEAV